MTTRDDLRELLRLIDENRRPNLSELNLLLRDMTAIRLNIKNFGYEIARGLTPALRDRVTAARDPGHVGLVSKMTTQSDMESGWFAWWCRQLKVAPIYHRKLWEYAFVLQVLSEAGMLHPGRRGIGYGCGREPMASYFASQGIDALVTDLAPQTAAQAGWVDSRQHASSLDNAFAPDLVDRETFDRHVTHEFCDMNALPPRAQPYDFCWSICAMEHLGSIENGLRFVEQSLASLRPGGIAVHTTEYNYLSDGPTIDNWATVLFVKKHILALQGYLERKGHRLLGPDFELGNGVLDRFVDLPPYSDEVGTLPPAHWDGANQAGHLKLSVDGFPCTCFGLIVQKKGA